MYKQACYIGQQYQQRSYKTMYYIYWQNKNSFPRSSFASEAIVSFNRDCFSRIIVKIDVNVPADKYELSVWGQFERPKYTCGRKPSIA